MKGWWANPIIPVSPVNRLRMSWVILLVCVVGWPVSTVLVHEPPVILGLSWIAIALTAVGNLMTGDVRVKQDRQ